MQVNAVLGKDFNNVKIGGIAIATVLGIIVTVSMIRNNMLSSKLMRANLAKLKDEGYVNDSWLEKQFAAIEESVGIKKKQEAQAQKKSMGADGSNTDLTSLYTNIPKGYWPGVLNYEPTVASQVGG